MKELIQLTEDLLTGVEEMDKDHAELVSMLNHTYQLLYEGKKQEAEKFFQEKILWYVDYHLTREEKFMESIGYPERERHRKAHENFRRVITDLAKHIETGNPNAFKEALALAWGWLAGHIGKVDKRYGEYAREKGLI
ncbi:MAG: bacteriohemerythrin [Aquificaceae bacterium]